jgi:small GTP-binding protein
METPSQKRQSIVSGIKSLLIQEKQFLVSNRGEEKDLTLLDNQLIQLDDLFLVVVAGEFNSGKSAFINALLGDAVLDTGVTPTTADVTILRYGEEKQTSRTEKGQLVINLPNRLLEDLSIVDTPGTNAILREHEELTTDFIPRSDLVLFVTSLDRPFTESERKFLESIRDWGKKIVIIINKTDIAENSQDLDKVKDFVADNAQKLLGVAPKIFAISAREALKVKRESSKSPAQFGEVEDYIFRTLDTKNRFQLKLLNPLGISDKLTEKYLEINAAQRTLIQDDIQLISDIQQQISLFREDMVRSFNFRYADIDNSILEFEKRGLEFFEDTFRINRVMDLLNKERIKNEFNKNVVKNLSKDIDEKVSGSIEWLVEEDLKQWQIVTQKISQRALKHQDRILSDPNSQQINLERQKIISNINRQAQRVVEEYDREVEASNIAEEAQMAVAASAAVEVGAIGLGTLITLLATTASADLTGILLAGLTATLGFFILPAKKKQTKNAFSENIASLREKLSKALMNEFAHQIDIQIENIQSTIQPYTRFIRAEDESISKAADTLKELSKNVESYRNKINDL